MEGGNPFRPARASITYNSEILEKSYMTPISKRSSKPSEHTRGSAFLDKYKDKWSVKHKQGSREDQLADQDFTPPKRNV